MPNITKSFQECKPLYTKIPRLENLNTSKVLNSIVCCRVCRGQRLVAVKSDSVKTFTYTKCFLCNGTGVMSNREY